MTAPNCSKCPFSKDGKANRPIATEGDPKTCVMAMVGEGPGKEETRLGRPFVGRSGGLLTSLLKTVGLSRTDVYLNNATLCPPFTDATPKDRLEAAKCCFPRLNYELGAVKSPIVALGGTSASILLDREVKIVKEAGTCEKVGANWILKAIHPAAVLRSVGTTQAPDAGIWGLHHVLKNAKALYEGKALIIEELPLLLHYDRNNSNKNGLLEDLLSISKEIKELGWMACDVETLPTTEPYKALAAKFAKLEALGIATHRRGFSAIWDLVSEEDNPEAYAILDDLLNDPKVGKVFHNATYDIAVLKSNLGWDYTSRNVGEIHDTMLEHHVVFPGAMHRLQVAAAYYAVVGPWKDEFRDSGETDSEHVLYNARDTLNTANIHKHIATDLGPHGVTDVYNNDRLMAQIAADMHLWGMPVCREVNKELADQFLGVMKVQQEKLNVRVAQVENKVWRALARERALEKRLSDPEDYKVRIAIRQREIEKELRKGQLSWAPSNPSHIAALCDALGSPIEERTEKGKTSTDKEVLRKKAAEIPLVNAILTWRENQKMYGDHVRKYFDWVNKDGKPIKGLTVNGRIHPVWKVTTLPGRWAAADPPAMTISKGNPKKGIPNLRKQIKAPPGRKIVGFDYAQMHPRIIAGLSKDKALLQIVSDDSRDIHTECARMVWEDFDKQTEEDRKALRQAVKAPEYTFWYAGSPVTAWIQAARDSPGTKLEDVEFMFGQLRKGFPGVVAWQEKLNKDVLEFPYEVRDAYGGRRQSFNLGHPSPSDVVNFPVLATETRIMQRGITKLWTGSYTWRGWSEDVIPKMGPLWSLNNAMLIHQCHDSLALEVDESEADQAKEVLRECFEMTFKGVLMKIDAKVGDSLGDV